MSFITALLWILFLYSGKAFAAVRDIFRLKSTEKSKQFVREDSFF